MNNRFFTGYRRNIIEPDEVLLWLNIPKTTSDQYFIAFKQSKRRDDDIAIVSMALNVSFEKDKDVIANINVTFGGMAPTIAFAPKSCAKVIGHKWDRTLVEIFNDELMQELPLDPSAPGGMIQYRRTLTLSLFFKAFLEISQKLEEYVTGRECLAANEQSGSHLFHTLQPKSSQVFKKKIDTDLTVAVGQPIVHASAFKQATGEAVYCDDMPRFENELYLAFVTSTKAHARLISIDATEALRQPGVTAFFSAKDLTIKQNTTGAIVTDEEVFASKMVTAQGQILGAIVADNQIIAQSAARLVQIVYEEIQPIIVTIEDAIAVKSFFSATPQSIEHGDWSKAFAEADVIINGECRNGGQDHFYLETHATVATLRDNDELEIFCSTQSPHNIQEQISLCTGLPANKITLRVKRIGGGFGGKETQCGLVALPVAIAAFRLGRSVRCMLDRSEDMIITGGRHPFLMKYKVAAMRSGKISACDMEFYSNGGHLTDVSTLVSIITRISVYD